jgi:hypothetical protein
MKMPKKSSQMPKRVTRTQIVVKFDTGFNNNLYVRGSGGRLSWDKGVPLKNAGANTWVFETRGQFDQAEFKILINDQHYENGENHTVSHGEKLTLEPIFTNW